MIQETIEAKSEIVLPLEQGDAEMVGRLGIQELYPTSACVRRGRRAKHKIQRLGKWLPPPEGFLKVNMDGSSRGNPGSAGIGGIGRDYFESVILSSQPIKGYILLIGWKALLSYMP